MSNEYKEEFDEVLYLDQFRKWLARNIAQFIGNLNKHDLNTPKSLRDWVKMFLDWSEYSENKDE